MRVCILKSTGAMVESQEFATEGTLINNMKQYYSESDLEEKEVNAEDYEALKLALPAPITQPTEIEVLKQNQELMKKALDDLLLSGGVL